MGDRPSIVELYRTLTGLMLREERNQLVTSGLVFPAKFHITEQHLLLRESENQIVKIVNKKTLVYAVAKFVDKYLSPQGYLWTNKQSDAFVEYWASLAPEIPMPRAWAYSNEPGLTFHRLPWDGTETGPTPTWDELMGRMDNWRAFMTWVGSLFDEKSDRQSYVWMHGEGSDGKGSILRFLHRVFGNAFSSEVVPGRQDRFWTYGLLGKRVVAFPDTNDAGFPASGLFKALTGGDSLRMEIKGGASFTSPISAKIIFASNEKPDITAEKADVRRIILCCLRTAPEVCLGYEEKLWDEGGAFLSACRAIYAEHGPGPIQTNTESLDRLNAENEEHFKAMFQENFNHWTDEQSSVDGGGEVYVVDTQFTQVLHEIYRTKPERREFRKYLERRYGIRRSVVRYGDGYRAVYKNITLKKTWGFSSKSLAGEKPIIV